MIVLTTVFLTMLVTILTAIGFLGVALFEPGTVVVYWTDPNESDTHSMITMDAAFMNDAKASFRDLPIIDYFLLKRIFKPKDKLCIGFIAPAVDTIVTADSYLSVPVTMKNLRTKKYEEGEISKAGKYVFTDDVLTTIANTQVRLWYYTIPDGISLVLGKRRAFNSRLLIAPYDDTA